VRRLPIRLQVTLAFAAALALVLLAVGTFVYLRFDAELTRTVDAGLQTRAAEVTALRGSGAALAGARSPALEDSEESFALVLSGDGTILDATPGAPRTRLTGTELRRPRSEATFLERENGAADGEPARLLAVPARAAGEIVVVGAALDDQREALAALLALGGLGLVAALLLASAAGYWVAGLALRPVEAMRAEADAITGTPDRRLPVPPVDDEIGRLGATLNAMLARLERSRAAEQEAAAKERRLVADASHELRTPLTNLKSEIDVALSAERAPGELRAALASAGEEADRLIRLAEALLVLARSDEGELPIAPEPVAVRELLDSVAARNGHRGEIVVDAPPGLTVVADRQRLLQAVTNMLDNALRHGDGPIELSAEDGDGKVRIGVRDHGPGFPPGFAERAFERFARPDAGRSGGGAGLGLAIVDAIARAHGGSAAAAAAEPGARVTITLPEGSSFHHHGAAG
jgi:two-component system, OmpR family, sensor kinase